MNTHGHRSQEVTRSDNNCECRVSFDDIRYWFVVTNKVKGKKKNVVRETKKITIFFLFKI